MSALGSSSRGGLPPPPHPASATLDDLQRAGADVPAGDLAPSPAAVGEADRGETSGGRSATAAPLSESQARATRRTPARAPLRRTSAETAAAFRDSYHERLTANPRFRGTRLRGTVRWFNDDKGHGCIAGEDGRDVFLHRSAISDGMFSRLIEGQLVEYRMQQSANVPQAVEVMPLRAVAARSR